jgi:cytochrome c oxidase cbb3-type subunit 3
VKENKLYAFIQRKLLGVKPVESDRDVLLDHDYDGIKELDNDLPPWWKYGFYLTI